MFSVINKIRDEVVYDSNSFPKNNISFEANSQKIITSSHTSIITPSKDTIPTSFGYVYFSTLIDVLQNGNDELKKKGLCELSKLSKLDIVNAIREGVIVELVRLIKDKNENDVIREYSGLVLSLFCFQKYGRDKFLENRKYLNVIENVVRENKNNLICLRVLSIFRNIILKELSFKSEKYIKLFIEKISMSSNDDIKRVAIECIQFSLKNDSEIYKIACDDYDIINILNNILEKNKNEELLSTCVYCISLLCFQKIGVDKVVNSGKTLNYLIKILTKKKTDKNIELKESITSSLMYITLNNDGKIQFIKSNGGIDKIIECVQNPSESAYIKMNSLKVISNVVENAEGQKLFKTIVPILKKEILVERNEDVVKGLKIALKKVLFSP